MGSYAEDMRLFGEWTQDHRLSAAERLLYHRIRWVFDRAGDPAKLPIKSIRLMEMEDMTQSTFNRARKRLESEGLIRTETQRGQETLYELLPIIKNGLRGQSNDQSNGQSNDQSNDQSNGQSGAFRGRACAREDTYVSLISKNNIIYNNSLSSSVTFSGNQGGGTGEETGERPDISQVEEYIRRTGLKVDAQAFMRLNDAAGWKDGHGQLIRNWRIWLNGFAARNPQANAERTPNAMLFEQRPYSQEWADEFMRKADERLDKYAEEG